MLASVWYAPVKDFFSWLWRQLKKPYHLFKKRRFVNQGWEPTLDEINASIENILSEGVLNQPPEVDIKLGKDASYSMEFGYDFTFFVSEEEITKKKLANDSLVNISELILKGRGGRYRQLLPTGLRKATDYYAIQNVVHNVRPEAMDNIEELDDMTSLSSADELTDYEKIEQMAFADELSDFLDTLIKKYPAVGELGRVHKQVQEDFKRSFTKLQKSFRGFLVNLSVSRLDLYKKGLRAVIIPKSVSSQPKYIDWHLFFWINNQGIVLESVIETVVEGELDALWNDYSDHYFKIEGMDKGEVEDLVTDWAKGFGAFRGKRRRGPIDGTAQNLVLVLLRDVRILDDPIGKDEFRELTSRKFREFIRLTQKQVTSLLERGG